MSDRAYISRFTPGELDGPVEAALEWLDWESIVPSQGRVYIKPNFTYPHFKPGVTTSPAMIEALVKALKSRTDRITVVESDGGAHAWSADEAFEGHNLPDLVQRYGITTANLMNMPREDVTVEIDKKQVTVPLPSPLLHEADVFISMPVPKMHVMTGVSLGFKNQWGCIPDVKRLKYHHRFTPSILAINKARRPGLLLFDGTHFLDRSGPMDGDLVNANLIVASDSPGAGSLVCAQLMGIDPMSIAHLKEAIRVGMMPPNVNDVELNAELGQFQLSPFRLERTLLNYVALYAFHSRLSTWFLYNSRFAKPVHQLMNLVRKPSTEITPYW